MLTIDTASHALLRLSAENKLVHCCLDYFSAQLQNGRISTWLTVSKVHG